MCNGESIDSSYCLRLSGSSGVGSDLEILIQILIQ